MERIQDLVVKISTKHGIVNYIHTHDDESNAGEGYFGDLQNFSISGIKEREPIILHVIAKFRSTHGFLGQTDAVTWMFAREIFVYEKVLPLFKTIDEKFTAPACYYLSAEVNKEVIALQDMTYSGYRLYRKNMFFDLEHAKVSVQALARFHALSTFLKLSDPINFKACADNCQHYFAIDKFANMHRRLSYVLELTSKEIGGEVGKIIEDFVTDGRDLFDFDAKVQVLCHGDAWKNNILFEYQDDRPASACLLDYQIAHIGAAALDLIYLIATSMDSILRKHHFEELIRTYHDTVVDFLMRQGISSVNIEECFSFRDFKEDIKLVGRASLLMANHSFLNWLGIDSINELNDETFMNTDVKVVDEKVRKNFNNIITDLVLDFKRFQLI